MAIDSHIFTTESIWQEKPIQIESYCKAVYGIEKKMEKPTER